MRSSWASSDEHRVTGPLVPQPAQHQRVGADVAGVAEPRREVEADLVANPQQQPSGVLGQVGGQRRVGQSHLASIAAS